MAQRIGLFLNGMFPTFRRRRLAGSLAMVVFFSFLTAGSMRAQTLAPDFRWARSLSGSRFSLVTPEGIIYDRNGNIYVAGAFRDTVDFDPGPGTVHLIAPRFGTHGFVCKYNRNGSLIWARAMEGKINGQQLAADRSGNIYMTGVFSDTADFDPGPAKATLIATKTSEVFVCRLSSAGNLVWVRAFYGPSGSDISRDIQTDAAGNVLVTGSFAGTVDFDPGIGTANRTASGPGDVFVCKLDPFGSYIRVWQMGGSGQDGANAIALDHKGNIYTAGTFDSKDADFDPGTGTGLMAAGKTDFFVSKLDANGNYVWAKKFTGANQLFGTGLAVGAGGDVYINGNFRDTADFDPSKPLISTGADNVFVSKLDSNGRCIWAKALRGTGMQNSALDVDRKDNVYSTGAFWGTIDFNPDTGVYNLVCPTSNTVYVSKLDSAGRFVWAGAVGASFAKPYDVAIDDSGFAYISGYTVGGGPNDFDPGSGVQSVALANVTTGILFKWGEGVVTIKPATIGYTQSKAPVLLFPQPASGQIFIRCEDPSLYGQVAVVHTPTGGTVAEIKLSSVSTIDVSRWASGVYFLRLPDGRTWKMVRE